MAVTISGHHMDTGEGLQTYVQEQLHRTLTRYFDCDLIQERVVFTKEGRFFAAEITIYDGSDHLMLRSEDRSDEVHAAFDNALSRMLKQLRRYKDRLHRLHRRAHTARQTLMPDRLATKYILDSAAPAALSTQKGQEDDPPLIIAEKAARIEISSVAEAVMRMEVLQLPALLFVHGKTRRMNLVYKRDDGNVAWVDPCE